MAISNARSSAYRAAGNWKSWGSVKGVDNSIHYDGPMPEHIERYRQELADKNDAYHLTKADIRASLERDCKDMPVTEVPEGMTAKKMKKQGLTKKKKPAKVKSKPSKKLNRKQRRELARKVDQEKVDKRKQFK